MIFWFALLICAAGTTGLFYLDRDRSVQPSKALWLPVIWLLIVGSRPVSAWLGILLGSGPIDAPAVVVGGNLNAELDGSPVDAFVFMVLLAASIAVLLRRWRRTRGLLKANLPILIYFTYCLLSIFWSPFPEVAFKRWTKGVGDLAMVLVVLTDTEPVAALRHLFSRAGFVLLPASILLIRYSAIGRSFTPDGSPMNTGVADNKNTLGLIAFVITLGATWSFLSVPRTKREPDRARHLVARGSLVAFGVAVLAMAHSATSDACFILGAALIFMTYLPFIRRRPGRVHALTLVILLCGGMTMLVGGETGVVNALGRDTTLTGRTEIWQDVIPMCPNPVVGAGFESFWSGYGANVHVPGLSKYMTLNEAHNGYIEVYLNLGWVGVGLIVLILISGYRRACAAFQRSPEIGSLMLVYIATAAIYSITEAGFRILTPSWIFLLLAVIASSGTIYGLVRTRESQRYDFPAAPFSVWTAYREFGSFQLGKDS
jgi:exopolysaccharide production protein ExoQ